MEKTNNVFCKTWGQFGGTTCQTVLHLSVSQSVTSFPPLPVMTGLHVLSELHASPISENGSAVGVHTSAQLSLTESIEGTGQASAICAAGNWSPLCRGTIQPQCQQRQPSHGKSNDRWRTELRKGNYDQLQRAKPKKKWVYSTANFPLSAACEHLF